MFYIDTLFFLSNFIYTITVKSLYKTILPLTQECFMFLCTWKRRKNTNYIQSIQT